MISKDKMSVTVGVAFVWFTTQFGGGFASGNQLRQYFVQFGIWAFVTCIMTQFLGAFFQWYALRYAKKHEVYDYRSFNNFIFAVAVYGTNVVRKVAATLSVLIVAGLLIVYIPNIIAQWGDISANISASMANPAPFGKALWIGFVYAAFQLASIGLLVQHAKPFASPDDAKTSMVQGFFVNVLICLMAVVGLMAIANDPNFATESIPLLILVNRGVAPGVLRPIISILIVLGSVSTAVNMIAGMSNRVCSSLDKNFDPTAKPGVKVIVVTLICTVVAFGIAQLGLNKIVAVGYKYLGYLTIPVIMIPYLVHMAATKFDTKD